MRYANEVGLRTCVSSIPHKLNYFEFERLIELCITLRVESHRSMPFIPIGRGAFSDQWILNAEEYAFFIGKYHHMKSVYASRGISLMWGDPMDHLFRMSNNAIKGMNSYQMIIKANGDVAVSPYFDFVVDNVLTNTMLDIWEDKYKKVWANPKWTEYISNITSIKDFPKKDRFVL